MVELIQVCLSLFAGVLIVDGREYRGATEGRFQGLDLVDDMYLGGVPDFSTIARAAGFREGFVGL